MMILTWMAENLVRKYSEGLDPNVAFTNQVTTVNISLFAVSCVCVVCVCGEVLLCRVIF
jgi:CBS domain containing-hemolysin-like protein